MRERLPLVLNQDTGVNQSAADAHLRRLGALEQEVLNFKEQICTLHLMCEKMTIVQHFDSTQVFILILLISFILVNNSTN